MNTECMDCIAGQRLHDLDAIQDTQNRRIRGTTRIGRSKAPRESARGSKYIIKRFKTDIESETHILFLQSERAARRASILQMATMYTAFSGTLLNVGVTLASQGQLSIANGSFIGACE